MTKQITLISLALVMCTFGCRDKNLTAKEFLNKFNTLMTHYIYAKNHPKRDLPNKTLVNFIRKHKKELVESLEQIYFFRKKNKKGFLTLFKKNKVTIVAIFKKLQQLDPIERMLFQYFSFVFSPDDISFNKERLSILKNIFLRHCELLENISRKKGK